MGYVMTVLVVLGGNRLLRVENSNLFETVAYSFLNNCSARLCLTPAHPFHPVPFESHHGGERNLFVSGEKQVAEPRGTFL